MSRIRLVLPILAALLACLAVGAGTASAKTAGAQKPSTTPCWKKLLADYFADSRVDGTYAKHCYTDAEKHLPEDVLTYGEAKADIHRALLEALLAYNGKGGPPAGPNTLLPPADRHLQGHKKDEGFFSRLAGKLGPGNATSIPLPLLILAGVGLLLLAAAGASLLARRIQARRVRPRPATVPPTSENRRR